MASSTAGKIRCYLLIIQKIKRDKYVSLEELINYLEEKLHLYGYVDKVGTSERTIRYNFEDILELFGVAIEYSKANNGYYISNGFSQSFDYERLMEQFNLIEILTIDNKLREFIFTEKKKGKGTEYLSLLIDAIQYSKRIEFRYRKFDNTVTKERRIVEPYGLKEFRGRWYLLAVEVGKDVRLEEIGQIKTWGLDRIENFHITNYIFSKNRNLNIEEEFKNCFGIHSDEDKEVEEIILSFAPMSGKYNEALPLHESQETLIDNENEFRIKLKVKVTYDFIMELLSQSEGMKVISPKHLKNKLIDIHKKAIKSLLEISNSSH